jgi:hypothetical protein
MLVNIAITLLIAVGGLAAFVATRPAEFRIARSRTLAASPAPWTATNSAQFDFVPDGPGTTVTWAMTGRNNFMAKAFSLAFDVDKMLCADFERGLANLDAATATPMRQARPGS